MSAERIRIPRDIMNRLRKYYRPGQEKDRRYAPEWLMAAQDALEFARSGGMEQELSTLIRDASFCEHTMRAQGPQAGLRRNG